MYLGHDKCPQHLLLPNYWHIKSISLYIILLIIYFFYSFMGEKMDMDATIVLAYFKDPEADMTPTFCYFLDGMVAKTFWAISKSL